MFNRILNDEYVFSPILGFFWCAAFTFLKEISMDLYPQKHVGTKMKVLYDIPKLTAKLKSSDSMVHRIHTEIKYTYCVRC